MAISHDPTIFLSTPSARRATRSELQELTPKIFLSTPSARRATKLPIQTYLVSIISIHALREEGDLFKDYNLQDVVTIYIHALREEGDS